MSPDNRLYVPFRSERTVSDVLSAAFVFLREEFRGLLKALLYIAGPPTLVAALVNSTAGVPTLDNFLDPDAWAEGEFEIGFAYWLGMGLNMVGWFLAMGVCYSYVMRYESRGRGGFEPAEVWERLRGDLRIHASTLLWLFAGFFLLALMNIVVCLGTLAAFVLACYLGPVVMLVYPARLDRREGFWAALRRCRALLRGAWWPAFGLLIVTMVVMTLVSVGVSAVVLLLTSMIATFVGAGVLAQALSVVLALLSLASYLVLALPAVAFAIHYFNLVEQHEGVALESRVEAMAQEASDASGPGGLAL